MAFDVLNDGYPPNDLRCAVYSGDDVCPQCLGDLDAEWKCVRCGFDTIRCAYPSRPPLDRGPAPQE